MTVTADNCKRVVLPQAKPGDRFDLEQSVDGTYILRKLDPIQSEELRMVRINGKLRLPANCKPSREIVAKAIRADRDSR